MLKKVVYLKQQNTRHKQPCFLTSQRNLPKMASETAKFSKELLQRMNNSTARQLKKKIGTQCVHVSAIWKHERLSAFTGVRA